MVVKVESENVRYLDDAIESTINYTATSVVKDGDCYVAKPTTTPFTFRTEAKVPKLGVMLVGWGGNNGTTVTGGIIANKLRLTWRTKEGEQAANYFGSITQSSVVKLGVGPEGEDVNVPLKELVPLVDPNDIAIDGWDISSMNLGDAMRRAKVFDWALQEKLYEHMQPLKPRKSIYIKDFIAANQETRADNTLSGSRQAMMETIRSDIRDFKAKSGVDKVIVLWTANTERFASVVEGVNTTADELLASIQNDHEEIAPSTLFAVASILEGCSYINGSPQNTFVPGVVDLAVRHGVFIGGDDFKSGQTKMKSVLVDFLVGAGIKPTSIVSYNHLGNNDGKNLSAPQQFRSKEISKSNVVDDMVESNGILYGPGEHPDHVVVIKYVPYVGDSKRAMDEYMSEIFMGGHNTIVLHNTCEDSLLAAPLIIDLILLTEVCERIRFREQSGPWERFHPVLSVLSYLLKAPMVPPGTPVINALFKQRSCIENILRACIGLMPDHHMMLEHKRLRPAEALAQKEAAEARRLQELRADAARA